MDQNAGAPAPAPPSLGATVVEVDGFRIESSSQFNGGPNADQMKAHAAEALAEPITHPDPDIPDPRVPHETPPKAEAAAEPEPEPAGDEPAKADEPAKPKKGDRVGELRARIHATTRELHETRTALDVEQRRLNDLRREREALEAGTRPDTSKPAPAVKAAATEVPSDDPKPTWDGDGGYENQGKTWREYENDKDAWLLRQAARDITAAQQAEAAKLAAARAKDAESAADAAIDQRHQERVQRLFEEAPELVELTASEDFQQMPRTPFMTTLIKLHDQGDKVLLHLAKHPAEGYAFAGLDVTEPMMSAFRESDDPVRLLSALANNPREAERIARLSPTAALKALWVLESSAAPDAKTGPSAAPLKQAKPPLPARVTGSRSAAPQRPLTQLGTDDVAEYIARANAGEALA